jgi:hypothetical protein
MLGQLLLSCKLAHPLGLSCCVGGVPLELCWVCFAHGWKQVGDVLLHKALHLRVFESDVEMFTARALDNSAASPQHSC